MDLYKFITGFVALGTAACAAFFSVIGIATFLGGNFWEVAVMAGFLEAGKLVCASAAYRFRKVAAGWIRSLLVVFTLVMMFITSTGIFGFLSSSYQQVASERSISQQQIQNVKSKRETFKKREQRLQQDRKRLIEERNQLQNLQSKQGWLSERQDERLSEIPNELESLNSRLSATQDSVLSYNQQITELQAQNTEDQKLGPIVFVAETVGLDEDKAALYFILLLIFVFDPMAVTLVVALSMATGLEESVTEDEESVEEEQEESEAITEPEVSPKKEEKTGLEVARELGKPLPEEDSRLSPDERIQRMGEYASIGDMYENEEDEEENPKTAKEFIEERKQETDERATAPFNAVEEETSDDEGFEEWFENVTSDEEQEKRPWENPFKAPYGNET